MLHAHQSSTYAVRDADKAIDGDITTYANTAYDSHPTWIAQLAKPVKIEMIEIWLSEYHLKTYKYLNFKIETSMDNINWSVCKGRYFRIAEFVQIF